MARGKKISEDARLMIVRAYTYFLQQREGELGATGRTREKVAECIGTSISTVDRVWSEYKKREVQLSSTTQTVVERRGRPRSFEDEDVVPIIRTFVDESNKNRDPITAKVIAEEVAKNTDIVISRRAMSRLLHRTGFIYIKGESRHYMADSVHNVAYRATYLQAKVSNRDRNNLPIRPEVYLDESYVNVNHVRGPKWLGADRKRYAASGQGSRICIVAAGVLYRQGHILCGRFVEESFENRVASRKGSAGDYHGNFNAEQFERWFTDLCQQLSILHGPCNIYMDGAAYHKRNILPAPTTRTKRADILQWLEANGIPHNKKDFKAQLLELVREHKPPPFYMAVTITMMYGHRVTYTPPYHPELQPIELIWCQMKGWIGNNPAKIIGKLEEKVDMSKKQIQQKNWKTAYKHVQKVEDAYLKALQDDAVECAGEIEGSESEGDIDSDNSI